MTSTSQPATASGLAARLRGFIVDVGALGVLQIMQRLPGLLLLPLITHHFGAAGFGIWSLFFVLGEVIGTLCDMALDDALIRFVAGSTDRADQREHFYSLTLVVTGVSIVVAIVLALLAGPAAQAFFGDVAQTPIVYLLCIYLIFDAWDNLALNMLRALLHIRTFVILEATQLIARTLLVIWVLYSGGSLWWALAIYMAVQVVWLVTEFVVVYSMVGLQWPTFKYLRMDLAYSLPLVPGRYSNQVLTFSDRLIIGFLLGPAEAGIYAASYDLAFLIWQIVTPIRIALYPMLSKLWDQGHKEEAGHYLTRSIKFTVFLALPSAAGLSVLVPHLLKLLSTAEFVQSSYVIVPLVAIATIMQGLSLFFSIILRLHKNTRIIAIALVISASLHLVFNFLLIPIFGIVGGALATILGYLIDLTLVGWLAWRRSQFALPWRSSLVFAIASLVMIPPVVWLSQDGSWVSILLAMVVGGAFYAAITVLLKGITLREIQVLLNRKVVEKVA